MTGIILKVILKEKINLNKQKMKNLIKAVITVMNEVKGIEKSMTVGNGQNSYKGVPDKEVKKIIGSAMAKHGLCILPTGIKPTIKIERWEEPGYNKEIKQKQSVFTEVVATYLLMHESGESLEICGYGHGVDSQDKGAGKATTYALKYALLYSFLVPTGDIDDADIVHSQEYSVKPNKPQVKIQKAPVIVEELVTKDLEELELVIQDCQDMDAVLEIFNSIEDKFKIDSRLLEVFTNRKNQLS
jgi:hypothetical protein